MVDELLTLIGESFVGLAIQVHVEENVPSEEGRRFVCHQREQERVASCRNVREEGHVKPGQTAALTQHRGLKVDTGKVQPATW